MFICSVSTVMFNGNPLLRFDGYYILTDILEIPNLRQKATEITRRFFVWLCLGIEQPENPFLPHQHQWAFALYTVAAVIYRWLVVFSILFFLNQVFEPYGLKIIGQLIGLSGFFGLVVQPVVELTKFFYTPGRMNKMKKERLVATIAVVATAVLVVLFLPLPFSVKCTFEVQPRGAEQVFSPYPAQITQVVHRPGEIVQPGDTILLLESPDLEFELADLQGRLNEASQVVKSLLDQRFVDSSAIDQLQVALELKATAQKQYDEKKSEFDRLTIKAQIAGTVLPPAPKLDKQAQAKGSLRGWTGSPFDKKNVGALVAPTDLLCQIGDPTQMEAVLVIDQAYIDLVREGQEVRVLFESNTHQAYDSKVEKIAATDLKVVSRRRHAGRRPAGNQDRSHVGHHPPAQHVVSGQRPARQRDRQAASRHARASPHLHRLAAPRPPPLSLRHQNLPLRPVTPH